MHGSLLECSMTLTVKLVLQHGKQNIYLYKKKCKIILMLHITFLTEDVIHKSQVYVIVIFSFMNLSSII